MVGSYEESILRGRMSTGPSKPLDFTAQIGVLGKGDCKPKYPPHVTLPFPAVYYNWNNGAGRNNSLVDDEPSPYVGHIDLEHSLPSEVEKESHRKHRGAPRLDENDANGNLEPSHEHDCAAMNLALRKREKRKRRSPSPKAPLGGSYRIPQQGQLQIMIKNPNKTAVKLFLVPYDLSGMEAGSKTFIRQRCYSAGPVVEAPLTSNPPSSGTSTSADTATLSDPKSKPSLRYLIHLNICSPSKGRFYLHQHIRVVFANRVPDNKENLQTDIQLPEPRYSTYKATRDSLPPAASSAGAKLTAEKAQRRRSYGFGIPTGLAAFGAVAGSRQESCGGDSGGGSSYPVTTPPIPPIPSNLRSRDPRLPPQHTVDDLPTAYDPMDLDNSSRPTSSSDMQSPLGDKTSWAATTVSSSFRSNFSGDSVNGSANGNGSEGYSKLSRGDVGYGGVFGRPGTPEPGEGLLARRLRGLGMERGGRDEEG